MVGARRRRLLRQQRQQPWDEDDATTTTTTRRSPPAFPVDVRVNFVARLPADLLADIHHQLTFLDRVAFALVCRYSGHVMKPDTLPWLVVPTTVETTAAIVSVADGRLKEVPTCDPAMRGHAVVGSSHGWLVTADSMGKLRLANPVTGAQANLPSITTIPSLFWRTGHWFTIDAKALARVRFGGTAPADIRKWGIAPMSLTMTAEQLRHCFYRKVVLSGSPRSESFAAMLIMSPNIGTPAFATAQDPNWRLAPSPNGIEDAISHEGRFYSLRFSGIVEAWDRDGDTGNFTSTVVAPKLNFTVSEGVPDDKRRKYLAVAPDGRFMVVLKEFILVQYETYRTKRVCVFKVHLLDEARQHWEEATNNIGAMAMFVGVNSSLCVSTTKGQLAGIRPGCVYFTADNINKAWQHRDTYRSNGDDDEELRSVGVYSLRDGRVLPDTVLTPDKYPRWPLSVWFTPSAF